MDGVGYLSDNLELLKKMQGTGWSVVLETDLLAALPLALMSPATRSRRKQNIATDSTFFLGLAPTVPLSSPGSSSRLQRDVRLSIYHNLDHSSTNKASSSNSTPNALNTFLAAVKQDPSLLQAPDTVPLLAIEVGKKLCSLVLADDTDFDGSANMADLGLDSLVAVEMHGWWKVTFGFEISMLDLLSAGMLEVVERRVRDGLVAMYDA